MAGVLDEMLSTNDVVIFGEDTFAEGAFRFAWYQYRHENTLIATQLLS